MSVLSKSVRLFGILLITLACSLGSCEKRSQCPTYADSDPKNLFGEGKTFDESLKDNEKWHNNKKKDRKVSGLGKKPKREKKKKVSRKSKTK